MTEYRKREDGSVVSEMAVRSSFDGSLPPTLSAAVLDQLGFDAIIVLPEPVCGYNQKVVTTLEMRGNNKWYKAYTLVPLEPAVLAKLQEADRQRIWAQIKVERDRRAMGGIKLTVDDADYWFWTDEKSRGQYSMLDSMVRRKNLPDTYKLDSWKTMDGTFIDFTVALLHEVIDTGIQAESILFHVAEKHRQAIASLDNPNLYDWLADWPPTYEEFSKAQNKAIIE